MAELRDNIIPEGVRGQGMSLSTEALIIEEARGKFIKEAKERTLSVGEPWADKDFITVSKKISFAAAHYLPNYDGKCRNLHGHTWSVEIAVRGPVPKESGMVVDFSWLGKALKDIILELDHHLINDCIPNPTAEYITFWFRGKFNDEWIQGSNGELELRWVKVWESEDSMAMWESE